MKINFKDFILEVVDKTADKIKELAKEHLNDEERKAKLDRYVTKVVTDIKDKYKPKNVITGMIFEIILNQVVIPFIPVYTQRIYDYLGLAKTANHR